MKSFPSEIIPLQIYSCSRTFSRKPGILLQEGGFVITGDALFQGSIGRTDLPGGDYDTLIRSITNPDY